jgi:hypothetical protein
LLPDSSGQLNLPWESELSSAFRTASSIRYPSSQVQIGHQAKNEGMGTADSSTHLRRRAALKTGHNFLVKFVFAY